MKKHTIPFLLVLFVAWTGFALAEVVTLQTDSGTPWGFQFNSSGDSHRFVLDHPAHLLSISFYADQAGTYHIFCWEDDGGHKPATSTLLFGPIDVGAASAGWQDIDLVARGLDVTVDPPRIIHVGDLLYLPGDRHIALDDSEDCTLEFTNIRGKYDSQHPSEDRWVILGCGDYEPTPDGRDEIPQVMVRLTLDYVNKITETRFIDVAASAELPNAGRVAWGDFDNDGDDDLLLDGCRLFRNTGAGGGFTFSDVTALMGLPGGGYSGGLWGDYDNDGFLDILSTGGAQALWHNDAGTGFTDVTTQAGGLSDGGAPTEGAAWVDVNRDGFIDFYLADYEGPSSYYQDHLFINNGDGTFTDVTSAWNMFTAQQDPTTGFLAGRGVNPGDFNNDLWPDIYVSNYRLDRNLFWVNQGDGTFENEAQARGVEGRLQLGAYGHTIGSVWGDVNHDDYLDLFTANLAHSNWLDFSDISHMYINEGPPGWLFRDIQPTAGIQYNETHSDPSFADYDNDTYQDLLITCVYQYWFSEIYRNNGDETFTLDNYPSGVKIENGWGSGWSDYDHDGDLDLYSRGFFYQNRSDTLDPKNWLEVKVSGCGDNRAAIGARVKIEYQSSGGPPAGEVGNTLKCIKEGANVELYWEEPSPFPPNSYYTCWKRTTPTGAGTGFSPPGLNNPAWVDVNPPEPQLFYDVKSSGGGGFDRQIREVSGGRGTTSQDSLVQHFGLADVATVDILTVTFPSGTVQALPSVDANQLVTVQEVGAFILPSPIMPAPGQVTNLTADTCGGSYTVSWDLDDDGLFDDGTGTAVQHSWGAAGDYPVSVEVTDGTVTSTFTRMILVR
jgi:hypothetical protein